MTSTVHFARPSFAEIAATIRRIIRVAGESDVSLTPDSTNEMVPRLFTALAPLLLAIIVGGCAPRTDPPSSASAPAATAWVTSDDGRLALRLSVLTPRLKVKEDLHVAAQLRNVSQQKLTYCGPSATITLRDRSG